MDPSQPRSRPSERPCLRLSERLHLKGVKKRWSGHLMFCNFHLCTQVHIPTYMHVQCTMYTCLNPQNWIIIQRNIFFKRVTTNKYKGSFRKDKNTLKTLGHCDKWTMPHSVFKRRLGGRQSAVTKGTYCSCREPRFSSDTKISSSWPPVIPVPGTQTPSSGLREHLHIQSRHKLSWTLINNK